VRVSTTIASDNGSKRERKVNEAESTLQQCVRTDEYTIAVQAWSRHCTKQLGGTCALTVCSQAVIEIIERPPATNVRYHLSGHCLDNVSAEAQFGLGFLQSGG